MSVNLILAFSKNDSEQKTLNLGEKTKEERTVIEGLCRKLKLKYKSEEIHGDKINKTVTIFKPDGYVPGKKQKNVVSSTNHTDNDKANDPVILPENENEADQSVIGSVITMEFLDSTLTESEKVTMISDHRITDDILKEFCSLSSLPVGVPTKEYIVYYFDLLDSDPNYGFDAWRKFRHFYYELTKFSSYGRFCKRNETIASLVAAEVRSIYKDTPHKPYMPYVSNSDVKSMESNMYMRNNHNKWFISIDIKSAWFTLFKHRYFLKEKLNSSWEDFMTEYTDSLYVKTSKKFREIVFGRSGFQRIVGSNYRELQDGMLDFVKNYWTISKKHFQPYHLGNDELIIEVEDDFDIQKLKESIDNKFPDMFHTRKFKLVELGQTGFFVKQHSTGKIEFKVCGGEFIAQCIKFYTKQPILEIDRQFTNSNGLAVYKKSKFE